MVSKLAVRAQRVLSTILSQIFPFLNTHLYHLPTHLTPIATGMSLGLSEVCPMSFNSLPLYVSFFFLDIQYSMLTLPRYSGPANGRNSRTYLLLESLNERSLPPLSPDMPFSTREIGPRKHDGSPHLRPIADDFMGYEFYLTDSEKGCCSDGADCFAAMSTLAAH